MRRSTVGAGGPFSELPAGSIPHAGTDWKPEDVVSELFTEIDVLCGGERGSCC